MKIPGTMPRTRSRDSPRPGPLWVFDVEPGSNHNLSAARVHVETACVENPEKPRGERCHMSGSGDGFVCELEFDQPGFLGGAGFAPSRICPREQPESATADAGISV